MRVNEDQGIVYLTGEEAVLLYDVLFTKQADGSPASWIEWSDIGSQTKELVKNIFHWRVQKRLRSECPIYLSVFQRCALELTRHKPKKVGFGCHQTYLFRMLEWIDSEYTDKGDPPKWPCSDFPRVVSGLESFPVTDYSKLAQLVTKAWPKLPKWARYGDRKAWVFGVWQTVKDTDDFSGWDIEDFKMSLVQCNRKSLLYLSRADYPRDIVKGMDQNALDDLIKLSLVRVGSAEMHLVELP